MRKARLKHINRRLTNEERTRHAEIRAAAMNDFSRKPGTGQMPSPPGIPTKFRKAREAGGLTWYTLAKAAGVPNSGTIRDIEEGKDVKLSRLLAVAKALGLKLEVVKLVTSKRHPPD